MRTTMVQKGLFLHLVGASAGGVLGILFEKAVWGPLCGGRYRIIIGMDHALSSKQRFFLFVTVD